MREVWGGGGRKRGGKEDDFLDEFPVCFFGGFLGGDVQPFVRV